MKHCTLPTLLAVKTTNLPTVPAKTLRLVKCVSGKKTLIEVKCCAD